ncbi:MAG: hypothetical protein N2Z59_05270, partial [Alteraurantiacibacter sp.]|nr:hypothetical protein [Alteraurantiacibacter sp.]
HRLGNRLVVHRLDPALRPPHRKSMKYIRIISDQALRKNVAPEIAAGAMLDWVFAEDYRGFLKSFDPLRHGEISFEQPLIGAGDMLMLRRLARSA